MLENVHKAVIADISQVGRCVNHFWHFKLLTFVLIAVVFIVFTFLVRIFQFILFWEFSPLFIVFISMPLLNWALKADNLTPRKCLYQMNSLFEISIFCGSYRRSPLLLYLVDGPVCSMSPFSKYLPV